MVTAYNKTFALSGDDLIPLYELDLTPLSDQPFGEKIRFINYNESQGDSVFFAKKEYLPVPILGTNFGLSISDSQEEPQIIVADINRLVSSLLKQYGGEISGAILRRIKVFANNLDNGSDPDPLAAYPAEEYRIDSQEFSGLTYTFKLDNQLNYSGVMIPRLKISTLLDANNA